MPNNRKVIMPEYIKIDSSFFDIVLDSDGELNYIYYYKNGVLKYIELKNV